VLCSRSSPSGWSCDHFSLTTRPAFAAYRSDPNVARYQSWDTTYALTDADQLVASQDGVTLGDPGAWLQLAAVDRVTGALCGDCAVCVATDQPQTAEVGVTFAPATQGSGLATEALGAVVTRLFGVSVALEPFAHPPMRWTVVEPRLAS